MAGAKTAGPSMRWVIYGLVAGALGALVWKVRQPSAIEPLQPVATADAAPSSISSSAAPASPRACLGKASSSRTRIVAKPSFTLTAAEDLEERPTASGFELGNKKGLSVTIEEIPYPATVGSSLDSLVTYVVDNVRSTTEKLIHKTTLEATRWDRGGDLVVACYRGVAQGPQGPSAVFFSVTGKKTSDGGFRLVTLSLDAANSSDVNAIDTTGGALLAGLVVSEEPIRARAPDAAGRALLTLSEASARQLRSTLGKDDVVWVTVERGDASGFIHHLGARSKNELPPEREITRTSSREIPIVIDAKSVPLVSGTTIEWVEGQGFRFDNPNAATAR